MYTKKVSVVLVLYNAENFIKATLESIINQTYKNMEIIIVDDCSHDNTSSVIKLYQDKDSRIRYVISDRNRQVCNSGNLGFNIVTGDYIALIGHDDIWLSNKIEKQVEYMDLHPECGVCFTAIDFINENGEKLEDSNKETVYKSIFSKSNMPKQTIVYNLWCGGNYLCAPSAIIRKSIIDLVGGYQICYLQLQDLDLWLRILEYSELYILQECLTLYCICEKDRSNLSSTNDINARLRFQNESMLMQDNYLDIISDSFFKEIFGHKFKKKPLNLYELECEKIFLLYEIKNVYYMKRLQKLLNIPAARKILEEKYYLYEKDFYIMESNHYYWGNNDEKYISVLSDKLKEYEELTKRISITFDKYNMILEQKDQEILRLKKMLEG